jgi:hypothetical protein
MDHVEILTAMGQDEALADKVIEYFDRGMWDEWDAGLFTHAAASFGGEEFRIAAKAAASMADFDYAKNATKNNKENA